MGIKYRGTAELSLYSLKFPFASHTADKRFDGFLSLGLQLIDVCPCKGSCRALGSFFFSGEKNQKFILRIEFGIKASVIAAVSIGIDARSGNNNFISSGGGQW